MKLIFTPQDMKGMDTSRDEVYHPRLLGHPHPDGEYTGEATWADGRWWYRIMNGTGNSYETNDTPVKVICLTGVVHDEYHVKDFGGSLIFAVSQYPQYLLKGESL